MSSLKMTFSLASLVLILGLDRNAPVMAQEDLAVPLRLVLRYGFGVGCSNSRRGRRCTFCYCYCKGGTGLMPQ